jgi:hypothetical protein
VTVNTCAALFAVSNERADAIATWGCIIQADHEQRVID